jgi:predicted double-glycine peptidase
VAAPLATAACASSGAVPPDPISAPSYHVRSLLEMRQDKVVVQKWDLSCGAAALATLLAYQHDDPVPEKVVAEGMLRRTDALKVKHRGGFSFLDMQRFAESRGYEASGYEELALDNLVEFAPIIVPIQVRADAHFVVFRGLLGDRVALADPAWGNRTIPVAEFKAAWRDGLGFVVERRDGRPPPNRLTTRVTDLLLPEDVAAAGNRPAALKAASNAGEATTPSSAPPPPQSGSDLHSDGGDRANVGL